MIEYHPTNTGEDYQLLVICPPSKGGCGGKALISSRSSQSDQVANLYCICKEPLCGLGFVMTLGFSHVTSPSANQTKSMMLDILKSMEEKERTDLINQASLFR